MKLFRHARSVWTGLWLSGLVLPCSAEVTLDGSMGPSGALAGPNFQLGAELGQQLCRYSGRRGGSGN
jgi:hypothetical protein